MLRPLETKSVREKRERKNKIILSIIIAAIMILSVVGFTIEFSRQGIEKQGDFYEHKVKLGGQEVTVRTMYLANETSEVKSSFMPYIDYFANNRFYYYADASLKESSLRLLQYISYFSFLNEACVNESIGNYTCYNEELPVKDCKSNLIIFEQSNETSIAKQDSCIFIKGNRTEIDKAIDRFIYDLFGIK